MREKNTNKDGQTDRSSHGRIDCDYRYMGEFYLGHRKKKTAFETEFKTYDQTPLFFLLGYNMVFKTEYISRLNFGTSVDVSDVLFVHLCVRRSYKNA